MRFIIIGGGCYGIYHSGQLYKSILKGKLPADSRLIIVDRNEHPPALDAHGDKPNFDFVQSDWQAYLRNFFSDPTQYDPTIEGDSVQIVPAPFAPHLYFDWLQFASKEQLHELGRDDILLERAPFDEQMHLPYEYTDPSNGNHFMSRAGWTCPHSCIEPRKCPAIKDTRDWDLYDDIQAVVVGQSVKPSVTAASALQAANLPNGAPVSLLAPLKYDGAELFTCHHFSHGIGTIPARRLFEARAHVVETALQLNATRPVAKFAVGTISHCHGVVATLKISFNPSLDH